MRVALLQMPVGPEKAANLKTAEDYLRRAAEAGADVAVLPEMFCCPYDNACFPQAAEAHGGAAQQAVSALAAELGLYIVAGSIPEREGARLYNTSFVYGRDGRELGRHRKAHLFDVDVPGQRFRESDTLSPGGEITTFETEFGLCGLCVCFDLRFAELSRCMALRGARVLFVPAAFNLATGPAHWELLMRQRAVDNQFFTVGVSSARNRRASYVAYGHSMAVDPWGTVLCRAGAKPALVWAELDLTRVDAVRAQLPILSGRREDLYCLAERQPPAHQTTMERGPARPGRAREEQTP